MWSYRDVLAHYGVVALPCRVGDPDRKGKVEAGVGQPQKTPLRGLRFESLEAAQAYLDRWEAHWADTRVHGTTKRQVAAMFAEEQPALGPALRPVSAGALRQWGTPQRRGRGLSCGKPFRMRSCSQRLRRRATLLPTASGATNGARWFEASSTTRHRESFRRPVDGAVWAGIYDPIAAGQSVLA